MTSTITFMDGFILRLAYKRIRTRLELSSTLKCARELPALQYCNSNTGSIDSYLDTGHEYILIQINKESDQINWTGKRDTIDHQAHALSDSFRCLAQILYNPLSTYWNPLEKDSINICLDKQPMSKSGNSFMKIEVASVNLVPPTFKWPSGLQWECFIFLGYLFRSIDCPIYGMTIVVYYLQQQLSGSHPPKHRIRQRQIGCEQVKVVVTQPARISYTQFRCVLVRFSWCFNLSWL